MHKSTETKSNGKVALVKYICSLLPAKLCFEPYTVEKKKEKKGGSGGGGVSCYINYGIVLSHIMQHLNRRPAVMAYSHAMKGQCHAMRKKPHHMPQSSMPRSCALIATQAALPLRLRKVDSSQTHSINVHR